MKPNFGKLTLTTLLGLYVLNNALTPKSWHYLDGMNAMIHEAGHFIVNPALFPMQLSVPAGTLFQLLAPALCGAYFLLIRRDKFAASIMLLWFGQNLIHVSFYAGDALLQEGVALTANPVTGECIDCIHDWFYMLMGLGALHHALQVAKVISVMSWLTILTALALAVRHSFEEEKAERGPTIVIRDKNV